MKVQQGAFDVFRARKNPPGWAYLGSVMMDLHRKPFRGEAHRQAIVILPAGWVRLGWQRDGGSK